MQQMSRSFLAVSVASAARARAIAIISAASVPGLIIGLGAAAN
jgi:hypothetical protein